jgi:DNA-binding CsgD family transcriptional regulator
MEIPAIGQDPRGMDSTDLHRLIHLVFESSSNGMVLLDDERRFVRANGAAIELLELPRHRLPGLRVDDITPDWLRPCLADGWPVFLRDGSIVQRRAVSLISGRTIEVDYCATANVLPGRHLAIYIEDAPAALANGGARDDNRAERAALTPREREVVELVAMGLSGARIADELFISPQTVRTHVRNAMEKLGARTRAHLIAIALRDGHLAS